MTNHLSKKGNWEQLPRKRPWKKLPPCKTCQKQLVTTDHFDSLEPSVIRIGTRFDPETGLTVVRHQGKGKCSICKSRERTARAAAKREAELVAGGATCECCRREIVPQSVWKTLSPKEREGKRCLHARGYCGNCYKRLVTAGQIWTSKNPHHNACIDCSKPMIPMTRFYKLPVSERKGLVAHAGRGRCRKCRERYLAQMKAALQLESLPDDKVPEEHLKVRQLLRHGRRAEHARRVRASLARAGRV